MRDFEGENVSRVAQIYVIFGERCLIISNNEQLGNTEIDPAVRSVVARH